MISPKLPAKIHCMSKRRRKIALAKRIRSELAYFEGQENTHIVRAQLTRMIVDKFGYLADVYVQLHRPVDHIEFNIMVGEVPA